MSSIYDCDNVLEEGSLRDSHCGLKRFRFATRQSAGAPIKGKDIDQLLIKPAMSIVHM